MSRPGFGSDAERDAEARRFAQTDFSTPLLLEAGAGTGKTAVLVARVVAWSLGEGWDRSLTRLQERGNLTAEPGEIAGETLRRVVAITFTEAAAAEMASRVSAALAEIQRGGLPIGVAAEALPADPELRRTRATALAAAADQLVVRTIHAYCRRLLASHPLEAGIHPRVEVDADGQRQAAVVRQVLEERLPSAYGVPGDADFEALADVGIGPGDLEVALLEVLRDGVAPSDLDFDPLSEERVRALIDPLRDNLTRFLSACGERLAGVPKNSSTTLATVAQLRDLDAALVVEDGVQDLTALGEHSRGLDKKVLARLRLWARGEFNKAERARLGDEAAEQLLAACAGELHPRLRHLRKLEPRALQAVRRVCVELLASADRRLRSQGVLSFGGLLRGARDLLSGDPLVAARSRAEIDQLLVDEFQDTDRLQCELLESLAFGGSGPKRPTLFLVGDPKQSIYGWRNADLRAYDAFRRRLERLGRVLPLVVNFRSVPAILEEVSRVVRPVMEAQEGVQPAFAELLASPETSLDAGFQEGVRAPVEHWFAQTSGVTSVSQANEIEAAAVAQDLAELQRAGVPVGRVAVLVRTTTDLEPILSALRGAGLPVVVERESSFYQRREVQDAVSLACCILDPNDSLSFLATLRSPLVGVPDAALIPLWLQEVPGCAAHLQGPDDALLEELRQRIDTAAHQLPERIPGLDELADWPLSLMAFFRELGPLRWLAEHETAERFVEELRHRLLLEAGEAARYLGQHRVAALDRLFRDLVLAIDASGGSASGVAGYLRRAGGVDREHREGRPRSLDENAIQVLTIHRAKGLDFDQVYLLQTHKGAMVREDRPTQVAKFGELVEFSLAGVSSLGMWQAETAREALEANERVRLLYVALTRARRRLVISGRRSRASKKPDASHADLLNRREEIPSQPQAWLDGETEEGARELHDPAGVRWRLVSDAGVEGEGARPPAAKITAPDPARVRSDGARLVQARRVAEARASRPFQRTASDGKAPAFVHALGEESELPAPDLSPVSDAARGRRIAMATGSAVHAALEQLPLAAAADVWDQHARREIAGTLEAVLPPELREPALRRALQVWERFQAGPLAAQLRELAPHVIARELPVLLPAGGDAADSPVGYISGAIDLLVREPEDATAFRVIDYKTDVLSSPADREERARAYAAQGEHYVEAVRGALDLPKLPRFELWFLASGDVIAP